MRVDLEFRDLCPRLSERERQALRDDIVLNGVRDPIVVWRTDDADGDNEVVLDGHNRYEILKELGREHEARAIYAPRYVASRASAKAWILANQCARRNLSRDQQIALYALTEAQEPAWMRGSIDHATCRKAIESGKSTLVQQVLAGKMSLALLRAQLTPGKRSATWQSRFQNSIKALPKGRELEAFAIMLDALPADKITQAAEAVAVRWEQAGRK